jgi:hypothetical protein
MARLEPKRPLLRIGGQGQCIMKERPAAEVETRGEVAFAARGHRQIRLENGTLP